MSVRLSRYWNEFSILMSGLAPLSPTAVTPVIDIVGKPPFQGIYICIWDT